MSFGTMFFWEFVQNIPLVAGLMVALQLWEVSIVSAVTAMTAGSVLGALLIRLTERRIVGQNEMVGLQEGREPISVTLTNIVFMFLFMLALTIYLGAAWSSIVTDLLAGALIGFILSAGQSKAAGAAVVWRHSLAFAAAFPAAIITIRLLSAVVPLPVSILLITGLVTLIITFIDYGHLSTIEEGAN
jgi:hypothetical protein